MEFISAELALSIFATASSILGLILHFVKFRKERPRLNIEVLKFRHRPSANVKMSELRIHLIIHNRGDRATQLNSIELPAYQQKHTIGDAVDANKSLELDHYFKIPVRIAEKRFKCAFILHHTHGKKSFEAFSDVTSESLLSAAEM